MEDHKHIQTLPGHDTRSTKKERKNKRREETSVCNQKWAFIRYIYVHKRKLATIALSS